MARGGKRPGAGRKPNPHKGKRADPADIQIKPKLIYELEIAAQARKLCELGATDVELADFFGITTKTIYQWKIEFVEFGEATKTGKQACDDRVERSLYQRAVGYTFDAVKIMAVAGKVEVVDYREHVPPDVAAASLWLRNRRPGAWRDKQGLEVTGKDGAALVAISLTDEQLANIARGGGD